jgi:hypothetical protein
MVEERKNEGPSCKLRLRKDQQDLMILRSRPLGK